MIVADLRKVPSSFGYFILQQHQSSESLKISENSKLVERLARFKKSSKLMLGARREESGTLTLEHLAKDNP